MKINYRLSTTNDIDALVDLWNENAEWGAVDRQGWERVFYHTPNGPTTIVLATNKETDEVLAQFVFMPTRISVNGTEISACKPCAPIMKKSARKDLGLTTIYKMYQFGTKHFVSQGIYLMHIMPDVRWGRGFQLLPGVQVANFPLWCLFLNEAKPFQLPGGYQIENILPSDSRVNELWKNASTLHQCSIVRNAETLAWKLSHRNYKFIGVSYGEHLVGFAAYLYKHEIKGILIFDVLAKNEEMLKLILELACAKANELKHGLSEKDQINCEKVSILATPPIEKIVAEMGFIKNSYRFSLAVHVLGKKLSKKDVSPERWYVSAND